MDTCSRFVEHGSVVILVGDDGAMHDSVFTLI